MVYQFEDEWLDLVDEDDQVVDRLLRSEVFKKGLKNFRAVVGFLKNGKGQLWIPRRVKEKIIFPLSLDMSVAGDVTSGESYDEAFVREAYEEINFTGEYRFLGKTSPFKEPVTCFESIYEICSDDIHQDDYCEFFWLYPEEIIKRIANGDQAKSDLAFLVKKFYLS